MRALTTTAIFFCLALQAAHARPPTPEQANTAEHPEWTAPQPPTHVYGNTWYVGPRGLSVLLIVAPAGDVLIDAGVPGDAPLIEANIRALGVQLGDIKWIVNSHAHYDHAGDMARIARDTGAQVIASAADAPLLARGGRGDLQYGDRFPYPPVQVTRTVSDGERLQLGDLLLTAHLTPGHTPGNTTWTWLSCARKHCVHIVDIGSLSAPGYDLVGKRAEPGLVAAFERSFALVAALPCDIALHPHPEAVDFWKRVARRDAGVADALIDRNGCRDYATAARARFETELAAQRVNAASSR